MNTLGIVLIVAAVLCNAYEFLFPEKEQARIYKKTVEDTTFNEKR